MGFTSIIFLFFVIPFFLCIYNFFPFKFKNFIILLFSFFILVWGAPRLFIYFVVISIVNYFAGYFILKIENKIFKLIFTSFVMLFDIVGGHFIHNRNYCYSYFLKDFLLDGLYISIFNMNNISYLLDAYKNRFKFSKNILNYFVYVFMFFKFFAGPIVPFHRIKGEIERRHIEIKNIVVGVERLIFGLFKIGVLSYEIGEIRKFICFKGNQEISLFSAFIAASCMFFNFYFYFSGYCDIANGLLKISGFSTFENFGERIFCSSITKFFKYFNRSFTNYLKFYIFPWAKNKGRIIKFFKYFLICFFYSWIFGKCFKTNSIIYIFIIIFLEKLFLNKILVKIPRVFRHIYCYILIILFSSIIYFREKNEDLEFISYLFGFSGAIFDRSFGFVIMFFKFLIVLCCFFSLRFFLKWLKKPKKKYINLFRVFEKILYLVLLLISIMYCLNV